MLNGAGLQLREWLGFQRRRSVSEGVSKRVKINISLLQHHNVVFFSCRPRQ